jgi:predicted kinase/endonuclease/exonuclease/phosphatase family metal-dependent hydrolase
MTSRDCLTVLSWNVNSAEIDAATASRLRAIVKHIRASNADVVFLQEVTVSFKAMLQPEFGSEFDFEDVSCDALDSFFVMIMLRKGRISCVSAKKIDFTDGGRSNMGRFILFLEAKCILWNCAVHLLTTHLESCRANSATRMLQYEQLLRLMISTQSSPSCPLQICGGDFNLRDFEEKAVKKRLRANAVDVSGVLDAFIEAGSPVEACFSWRRTMENAAGKPPAQARFDRILYASNASRLHLLQSSFCLWGTQDADDLDPEVARLSGFTTASDHMGLRSEFSLSNSENTGPNLLLSERSSSHQLFVVVLIGAPGSGKSSLARFISPPFARVCQDAVGSRAKCEEIAEDALRSGTSVVIDRCNFNSQQRAIWIRIGRRFGARVIAAVLDVPLDVCSRRVSNRTQHEGGVQGDNDRASSIVFSTHQKLSVVSQEEGFDRVMIFQHTTPSEHIANDLLKAIELLSSCKSIAEPASRVHPMPLSQSNKVSFGAESDCSSPDSSPPHRAPAEHHEQDARISALSTPAAVARATGGDCGVVCQEAPRYCPLPDCTSLPC